jgi:hypothetical protein
MVILIEKERKNEHDSLAPFSQNLANAYWSALGLFLQKVSKSV